MEPLGAPSCRPSERAGPRTLCNKGSSGRNRPSREAGRQSEQMGPTLSEGLEEVEAAPSSPSVRPRAARASRAGPRTLCYKGSRPLKTPKSGEE